MNSENTKPRRFLYIQELWTQAMRAILLRCPVTVKKIIIYPKPSFDVIVALASLYFRTQEVLLGIDDAELEYMGRDEIDSLIDQAGDSGKLLLRDQTLVIGAGGSFLDEHAHERNHGNVLNRGCAAMLTAQLIGIENQDPAWQKILRYAFLDDKGKRDDHKRYNAALSLPNLIKMAYDDSDDNIEWTISFSINAIDSYYEWLKLHPEDPGDNWSLDKIMAIIRKQQTGEDLARAELANTGFRALYAKRKHAREQARADLDNGRMKKHMRTHIIHREEDMLEVIVAKTDDCVMQVEIFKKYKPEILVARRSSDHVSIFSRTGKQIKLDGVMANLQRMECEARGIEVPDEALLGKPGKITKCPVWYYYPTPENDMVFNKSKTNLDDIEPTVLTDDQIFKAIKLALTSKPTAVSDPGIASSIPMGAPAGMQLATA